MFKVLKTIFFLTIEGGIPRPRRRPAIFLAGVLSAVLGILGACSRDSLHLKNDPLILQGPLSQELFIETPREDQTRRLIEIFTSYGILSGKNIQKHRGFYLRLVEAGAESCWIFEAPPSSLSLQRPPPAASPPWRYCFVSSQKTDPIPQEVARHIFSVLLGDRKRLDLVFEGNADGDLESGIFSGLQEGLRPRGVLLSRGRFAPDRLVAVLRQTYDDPATLRIRLVWILQDHEGRIKMKTDPLERTLPRPLSRRDLGETIGQAAALLLMNNGLF